MGDSPADAVVREIREESGFETRATKLLALLDRNRHGHPPHVNHIYKVFLRCEIVGGLPTTSHEIQGVGFFAEDEIPDHARPDRPYVQALSESTPDSPRRMPLKAK